MTAVRVCFSHQLAGWFQSVFYCLFVILVQFFFLFFFILFFGRSKRQVEGEEGRGEKMKDLTEEVGGVRSDDR